MLEDVTVLELGSNISAPLVGQILSEYGANVIKVEPPDGDDRRKVKPEIDGISVYFASVNKGKKSVVINLKTEKGLEIFYRLASKAQVIVTNYRPSALKRLKVDYESVLRVNPKIIYCSITGFGHFSPMANLPAYDTIILSLSGLLDMTGEENPVKFATSISDITTALLATTAILASLHRGGPIFLDVPMLSTQFYLTLEDIYMMLNLGVVPKRTGSEHRYLVPYKAFKAKDGYIYVAVFTDEQYFKLCNALGRQDLLKFRTLEDRVKNRDYINSELEKIFMTREREYWVKLLTDADVPVAPVLNLKEAFDRYGKELEVRFRNLSYIKFPIKSINGAKSGAPKLGENTLEVLASLGYSKEEIENLKKEGVVYY
ncbi:MAG: CaiB/BaiF CoA-transferase family protein [Sulfolobaceae archaeon]